MKNQKSGQEFAALLDTLDQLLGPNGCPWDRKQTYHSLRSSLLEEAYEVLDALDRLDIHEIKEELGDLLFNVAFLTKIGEKEKHFTCEEVIDQFHKKIRGRHPHVFGDIKVNSIEEVYTVWEAAKSKEKSERKHVFEGIPEQLPALAKANKVVKKLGVCEKALFETEEELSDLLLGLVAHARKKGIDPEAALRKRLREMEEKCRRET